jgi:hypothetical protein
VSYRKRGAVYLVCYADTPYEHAGHYCGFAYPGDPDRADPAIMAEVMAAQHTRITCRYLTAAQAAGVADRIGQHRSGRGARLLAVVTAAGIEFTPVRIWASATEQTEKYLKDLNRLPLLCPKCNPGTTRGTTIKPKQFRRAKPRPVREEQETAA